MLSKNPARLLAQEPLQGPSYQPPGKGEQRFPRSPTGSFLSSSVVPSCCLRFPVYPNTFLNKLGAVLHIDCPSSFFHTQTYFYPSLFQHAVFNLFSYPVLGIVQTFLCIIPLLFSKQLFLIESVLRNFCNVLLT